MTANTTAIRHVALGQKVPGSLPTPVSIDLRYYPEKHPTADSSVGGMITRHVVNRRPDLFAGVIYVGVPQRAVNILGPLRNGDAVLLNEKIFTARVNLSLRTTFAFLPEDGRAFVDRDTGEDLLIDFYNIDDVRILVLLVVVLGPPSSSLTDRSG